MALIIILIALAVQYYLKFNSSFFKVDWVASYFGFLQKQLSVLTKGHGLFGVFLFIVPILIVVSLIFTLVYHLLGYAGYLILSLALVWYCLDMRSLQEDGMENRSVNRLFFSSYQSCFALLFWYFIFGPVGLVLYIIISELFEYLQPQAENFPDLAKYSAIVLGVLDWVPVRLLGLSFALVGHFGPVFKEWLPALGQGIERDQAYVLDWGYAAMSLDKKSSDDNKIKQDVVSFLFRALCVWLVAMALVSLGLWFG